MRSRWLPIAPLICVVAASSASAQHASGGASVDVTPEYTGCVMCHETHGSSSAAYSLRTGDMPAVLANDARPASPVGSVSLSCLRCHLTAELLESQPEFAGVGRPAGADGAMLNLDLSDDHPLGSLTRSPWREYADQFRMRTSQSKDVGSRWRTMVLEEQRVECTSCHDPHSRTGGVPTAEEQRVLCTGCHESATYALRDHASLVCGDCHALHRGNDPALLAEPVVDLLCSSCHDASGVSWSGRASRAGLPQAPRGHDRPLGDSCLGCHEPHR